MYKLQKLNFIRTSLRLKEIKANLEWCLNNYENICISDKDERIKYRKIVKYLLNLKGKNKVWTEEEAKMMIMFFSKDFAYKFELDEKIKFRIMEQVDEKSSLAVCISLKDGTYEIRYSIEVVDMFIKKREFPIESLLVIFHEIIHVIQNEVVEKILRSETDKRYNLEIYMVTLENLIRKFDKKFYDTNYNKLYKENTANKLGLHYAVLYLKKYMPKKYIKYDKEKINRAFKKFDKDYYGMYISCLGLTENYFEAMDALVKVAIIKDKKILDKYPVLKLGYKEDGTNKNIIELIEQRNILLQNQPPDEIDELFEMLANKRNYGQNYDETFKMEISLLLKYIEQTGTTDKFIYDLLKYRIEKIKEKESSNKEILYDLKDFKVHK